MAGEAAFCEAMLPRVSRTFALCIRLLPPDLEHPVLVAYLLCRIADTIEDTADLAPERKDQLLHHFATWLGDPTLDGQALRDTFAAPADDEQLLTHHADLVIREFRRLPVRQQDCIRPWVQEMAHGMAEFAQRADGRTDIEALRSVTELERYCYYVAGTVGRMLTALYAAARPDMAHATVERLEQLATSFGLGLQLTNIIKDVADDQRRGWSFVPLDLCQSAGIHPRELHDPTRSDAAQVVMERLIDKAAGHLDDAQVYCTTLPRRLYRIRLFCLTAMFFADRTLALARGDERLLDPGHKVKISRPEVYRTLATGMVIAPSNVLVRRYHRRLARVPR